MIKVASGQPHELETSVSELISHNSDKL